MSWVGAAIILGATTILIRDKTWKAFIPFIIGNALYAVYWGLQHEWATLILTSIFVAQNIWGLIKWRKDQRPQDIFDRAARLYAEEKMKEYNMKFHEADPAGINVKQKQEE
jgi:predicted membrane chloride channel (bestrophin family)